MKNSRVLAVSTFVGLLALVTLPIRADVVSETSGKAADRTPRIVVKDEMLAQAIYGAFVDYAKRSGLLDIHIEGGVEMSSFQLFGALSCRHGGAVSMAAYTCEVTGDLSDSGVARSLASAISTTALRVSPIGKGFEIEGATDMTHLPLCTFNRLSCDIDQTVGGEPRPDSCYLENAETIQCV